MAELHEVLDLLDLCVSRSDGVLSPDDVVDLGTFARDLRLRNGFVGEALVVALAGGTGSGKSSILNALVGDEVVTTGIVRPTTASASAVHRSDPRVDLGPLLDALAVNDRIAHDAVADYVIVDLPDFDSTATAHRHVVEQVLPRVDAVVWVVDPEKYADPVLHDEFLAALVPYERQFVFALNQADRLGDGVSAVCDDLTRRLVDDGFADPTVVATAAAPLDDTLPDVSALAEAMARGLEAKLTAVAKLALDLRGRAEAGWRACRGVDQRSLGQQSRDRVALAAASFVSLGVAAYALHDRTLAAMEARSDG